MKKYDKSLYTAPYLIKDSPYAFDEDFKATKMANGFITSEMWSKTHRLCPNCKSNIVMVSLIGLREYIDKDYMDDVNTAICRVCDWSGKRMDLVCE